MSLFKQLGNFAGEAVGGLLGGTVRVIGEVAGSNTIKEVGNGVESAVKLTGRAAGEVANGTWDTAAGIVKLDGNKMEEGLNEIGDAVVSAAKEVGNLFAGKESDK